MSAKRKPTARRQVKPAEPPAPVVWEGDLALEPGGVVVLDGTALDDRVAEALGAARNPLRLPEAQELGRVRIVLERLDAAD